jgi:hypothetical protein
MRHCNEADDPSEHSILRMFHGSVNRKLKFWYIFGLLSSKYTAVISIGSPSSLDTRYEFRHYVVTQHKIQI